MSEYKKADYWLESADYDLQTARAMLQTGRYLYVGFMCHQTIEKALKAVFVSRKPEEDLPYIHKLVRLANLSGLLEKMSDDQISLLDTLSPLNIEARYPMHKELLMQSLTPERCRTMIQKTEELFLWLRTKC